MCVKARRIEVGCGHFADELRQSRVFRPVVLPCAQQVPARLALTRDKSSARIGIAAISADSKWLYVSELELAVKNAVKQPA